MIASKSQPVAECKTFDLDRARTVKSAEHLHGLGFALHWLKPRSKAPIGNDWADKPVASVEHLERSYRPGNNLGVRLGEWSKVSGGYLHLVDLDIRDSSKAEEAHAALAQFLPGYRRCPAVISGSGGESRHYYFTCDKPFHSKKLAKSTGFTMAWDKERQCDVKKHDWEIELFGTGKQAVLPPSIHPDTQEPYRWQGRGLRDIEVVGWPRFPAEAMQSILQPRDRDGAGEAKEPVGLTAREIRAILDKLPADHVEDHDTWIRTGMAIHHETDGSEKGFSLWSDWAAQSDKFDEREHRNRWRSFKDKAGGVTMRTLEFETRVKGVSDDEFEDLGDEPKATGGALDRMNERFAFTVVGGHTRVMHFLPDGEFVLYQKATFFDITANWPKISRGDKKVPTGLAWWESPKQRRYERGIVFDPSGRETPDAYNLWRGWAVKADPKGSCKLILRHIREVICDGNEEHAEWLVKWLAHLFQRPEEKPGTAIVLMGEKRIGKDTLGRYISRIIGDAHYFNTASPDLITGRFNGHLENRIFFHLEEGFWAGDKAAESRLKSLITAPRLGIEHKGVDGAMVDSYLRVFISSNEDWVVPVTADEERYFVLNVPATYAADESYFNPLHAEMDGDGPAALLHYLLNVDLAGFNARKPPESEAKAEQIAAGLEGVEAWLHDVLSMGAFEHAAPDGDWRDEMVTVSKSDLRNDYERFAKDNRHKAKPVDVRAFGRKLTMLIGAKGTRPGGRSSRVKCYELRSLDVCRKRFHAATGVSVGDE